MPVLTGNEATKQIRVREKAAGAKQIPIVLMSGEIMPEDRQEYLKSGFNTYLQKPFSSHDLHDCVFALLDQD